VGKYDFPELDPQSIFTGLNDNHVKFKMDSGSRSLRSLGRNDVKFKNMNKIMRT